MEASAGINPAIASDACVWDGVGDRTTAQEGATKLSGNTTSILSFELEPASHCDTIRMALRCSKFDTERAYLYIRSNRSIEVNDTNTFRSFCNAWSFCDVQDNI